MKSQIERHESVALKQEYDKLRLENIAMKDLMRKPICQNCGGPAILGDSSPDDKQLRIENARLKDELIRVTTLAEKVLGRPVSNLISQITSSTPRNSNLDRSVWRHGSNGPTGLFTFENGSSSTSPMNGFILTSEYEKTIFMQAGIAAMDELLALAQAESPLWFQSLDEGRELLNYEEYSKRFSPFSAVRPSSIVNDATRVASSVFISSSELVDIMMFPRKWKDMFPCLVSKAATIEILFNSNNGTRDGELQLMNAEIVFPSPFIPVRHEKFLRFSKQHSEGMWTVVDVSLDTIRESSYSGSFVKWKRLPSGCIIQDVANGYSVVTWIEHGEYDENYVHPLYQPLLRSGLAFGAQRWLGTLQRECECAAILISSRVRLEDTEVGAFTPEGKKSMARLMKRVSNSLCTALSASTSRRWEKLQVGGLSVDVSIISRVSISEPGEPSGLVLSASTSVWMPVPRQHLFDFLRDEKHRGKWDILSNGGPMEVISCLSKSHDGTNLVSLLCPPAAAPRDSNMLILQDSWSDQTGSFIVYAPVDSSSLEPILKGADSNYLALLPSGFAIADGSILPDGALDFGGASVLTMGFQILVNSLPTTKLNVESIETVNNLMSCTIQKIRASFGLE
ncbi:hypothetical protein RND81_05G083700 [Saponaria officinalis]|uniref:START domain-containing protein n=1 Tax=Saponaria officinalis TaxID=3572 RepID=A0AAW1KRB4_SAPOF